MDRETHEYKGGEHAFRIKTYASAREANTIQQAYFKGAKVELVGEQARVSEFNPTIQMEVEQEMIRQLIVSMDGSAENVVDRCLDLPADEYRELIDYIDRLIAKKKN